MGAFGVDDQPGQVNGDDYFESRYESIAEAHDQGMERWKLIAKQKKAFTLVELLVVIAIIALLVSILLPALSQARDQSKRVVCAGNLRGIHLTFVTYAMDYEGKYPRGADWFSGSTSLGYFHVYNYHDPLKDWRFTVIPYIENGDMFYCPAGGAWDHEWITDASHPKGWDGIEISGAAIGMISYSLWPSDGLHGIPSWDNLIFQKPDGYVIEEDDVHSPSEQIMGQDFAWTDFGASTPQVLNHPGPTSEHDPQDNDEFAGFNNMYYDGHVDWRHYSNAEEMARIATGGITWFR
jgi:prepilin-type N-terminal cleavage/methylation domain-containing protein